MDELHEGLLLLLVVFALQHHQHSAQDDQQNYAHNHHIHQGFGWQHEDPNLPAALSDYLLGFVGTGGIDSQLAIWDDWGPFMALPEYADCERLNIVICSSQSAISKR